MRDASATLLAARRALHEGLGGGEGFRLEQDGADSAIAAVAADAELGIRAIHQVADHLADAFVVEQDGNTARPKVHSHSLAHDQGVGVADFKAVSIDQRNCERAEGDEPLKGLHRSIKVLRVHFVSLSGADCRTLR